MLEGIASGAARERPPRFPRCGMAARPPRRRARAPSPASTTRAATGWEPSPAGPSARATASPAAPRSPRRHRRRDRWSSSDVPHRGDRERPDPGEQGGQEQRYVVVRAADRQEQRRYSGGDRLGKGVGQLEIDALLKESVDLLKTKRIYSAKENPHYLVFEYFEEVSLRENQIELLKKFQRPNLTEEEIQNLLAEAHTGFGKSKLCDPTLALPYKPNRPDPHDHRPASLLEEMRVHLSKVLGKTFDKIVTVISFDRAKANDLKYLKYVNSKFEEAKEEGKCILLSIDSLHGLSVLKHKETYFKVKTEGTPPQHLDELEKIRNTLGTKVSNSADKMLRVLLHPLLLRLLGRTEKTITGRVFRMDQRTL